MVASQALHACPPAQRLLKTRSQLTAGGGRQLAAAAAARRVAARAAPPTMAIFAPLTRLFGGSGGAATATSLADAKAELLDAIKPLKRGLAASEEDQARVEALASALERRNPTKKPLASDLVNGQWELLYTTSDSILGRSKPALLRPSGPIYQIIDATSLTARNKEGPPLFNEVSAELIPESSSKVKVQFKEFKIFGLIPVKAPTSAAGELDVTYLDDELRISRGNRGNLFVLKMNNRAVKP